MTQTIEFRDSKYKTPIISFYTDSELIRTIHTIQERYKINLGHIRLGFHLRNSNVGGVTCDIIDSNYAINKRLKTVTLHRIDLRNESFRDVYPECVREKGVIQRAFPKVRVTSNFH